MTEYCCTSLNYTYKHESPRPVAVGTAVAGMFNVKNPRGNRYLVDTFITAGSTVVVVVGPAKETNYIEQPQKD